MSGLLWVMTNLNHPMLEDQTENPHTSVVRTLVFSVFERSEQYFSEPRAVRSLT